jgi:hypothetical protein
MLVGVEDFGEALQTQVVIPRPGKALVLPVQHLQAHVMSADEVAAPLLNAYEIVAVVVRT